MGLSTQIIDLIRDEIGDMETNDVDFVNDTADLPGTPPQLGSLEAVYTDTKRGNFSTLGTALIVWRRRLKNYRNRSFDISKEGNWLARSQKIRFMEREIKKLEALTGSGVSSKNMPVVSDAELDVLA